MQRMARRHALRTKTLPCYDSHTFELPASALGAGAHFDHPACSYPVAQADRAVGLGAMFAAEKCTFLFEPVTDDVNTAWIAHSKLSKVWVLPFMFT